MRNNWMMWGSQFSEEACEGYKHELQKLRPVEGSTFGGPEGYRNSVVRWVNNKTLQDQLWWFAQEANRQFFGLDVQNVGAVQFTEYSSGGGKYDWHHDINWESDAAFDRKISVVVQLSDPDDYEGCDFQFDEVENPHSEILRAKGTVLCFPSYLRHRVTEITKGTRYSLVAWFEGPRWK